jgi:hypothetical protein
MHLSFFNEQLFELEAVAYPKLSLHAGKISMNASMSGVPSKEKS